MKTLILFFVAAPVFAGQIVWTNFKAREFKYTDFHQQCSSSYFSESYLVTEFVDGQIVKAAFAQSSRPEGGSRLDFDPEEISGLSFKKDKFGKLRVTQMRLNGRQLAWLTTNISGVISNCGPGKKKVMEISPDAFEFNFNIALLEKGQAAHSERVAIDGTLEKDESFSAVLRLSQVLSIP